MRAIEKYSNQDDELLHPLWIGILLLLSIIIIVGLVCYIRVKCHSQVRLLCNRLFRRKTAQHSTDEKYSPTSYSYNWPSIYKPTKSQSPKLYTLVKNLRTANIERQPSIKESTTEPKQTRKPTTISSSPANSQRASEIARKFYASMRRNSQCGRSSSIDSYINEMPSPMSSPSAVDLSMNTKRDENLSSFRASYFFQSIPDTSLA
ncbi:unnamed protein product [Adineta ricciae]|uniref:Uncharacterized protein n=1 Tax=Adineta ricciae TaxID=249248 RepID=A0A816BYJ7_ADIRI|nr:unnamed protein product [Adineta ricciae]CAF1616056.1 unnamed protein product [Adineta ricciae]